MNTLLYLSMYNGRFVYFNETNKIVTQSSKF